MKKNIENSDMPISSPTTFEPRSVCSRKIENGTSGCSMRALDHDERGEQERAASAPRPSVCVEPQPALLASTSA